MRLIIMPLARIDLRQIADYISADSPRRALTFVDELTDASQSLLQNPERFALVDATRSATVRRLPHGNYLIFYRVVEDAVQIIRILHGARDYRRLLFSEN